MSHLLIDPVGLKQALAQVRDDFVTKDVSEQSVLRGAHGGLAAHSHWHAFVGKALRLHAVGLGIEFLDTGASRGARWQKLLATTERVHRPAAAIPTAPARPTTLANAGGTALNARRELGPQYAGDSAFTARMRFHQSHCRATVLRPTRCATSPTRRAECRVASRAWVRARSVRRGCAGGIRCRVSVGCARSTSARFVVGGRVRRGSGRGPRGAA